MKRKNFSQETCNKTSAPCIDKVNRGENEVNRCMALEAPIPGNGAVQWDACIASIAEGDKDALAALYEETHTAVYGFALSIVKNAQDAEDILQDVFVNVFLAAGSYRAHGKVMAWLLTIAKNLAFMKLRKQKKETLMSPEDWHTQFAEQIDTRSSVTREDSLLLRTLLGNLSDEERQIVTLHALAGCKHREIAVILGIPLPTVLSKYRRALRKLEKQLEEGDDR